MPQRTTEQDVDLIKMYKTLNETYQILSELIKIDDLFISNPLSRTKTVKRGDIRESEPQTTTTEPTSSEEELPPGAKLERQVWQRNPGTPLDAARGSQTPPRSVPPTEDDDTSSLESSEEELPPGAKLERQVWQRNPGTPLDAARGSQTPPRSVPPTEDDDTSNYDEESEPLKGRRVYEVLSDTELKKRALDIGISSDIVNSESNENLINMILKKSSESLPYGTPKESEPLKGRRVYEVLSDTELKKRALDIGISSDIVNSESNENLINMILKKSSESLPYGTPEGASSSSPKRNKPKSVQEIVESTKRNLRPINTTPASSKTPISSPKRHKPKSVKEIVESTKRNLRPINTTPASSKTPISSPKQHKPKSVQEIVESTKRTLEKKPLPQPRLKP